MQRETIQRKIIINTIHQFGHVSTSELIAYIQKEFPSLSVATIYRNLNTLLEDNLVRRVSTDLLQDIYEDTTRDIHDHFICEECGIIIDKENPDDSVSFVDDNGNLIAHKAVTYYGVCKDCLNRKKS